MSIPNKPDYDHGSTGTEPANPQDYENGDPLDANNLDYYIYTPFQKIKELIDALHTLDSDNDGRVDAADTAQNVKGNDIDTDGDGAVDAADTAQNVKGNDIDSDGDGTVDAADYANDADASSYKGNDIDNDGDGIVDAADALNGALRDINDVKLIASGTVDIPASGLTLVVDDYTPTNSNSTFIHTLVGKPDEGAEANRRSVHGITASNSNFSDAQDGYLGMQIVPFSGTVSFRVLNYDNDFTHTVRYKIYELV